MGMQNPLLIKRYTAQRWTSVNPILPGFVLAMETDTLKIKIGNGRTRYNDLGYIAGGDPGGGDVGGEDDDGGPIVASSALIGAAIPSGPELLTNGTFNGNAAGWTLGSDVAYGDHNVISAYVDGDASASVTFASVTDKDYLITFTVSDVVGNGVGVYCHENRTSTSAYGPYLAGTHTVLMRASYTGTDTIVFDDDMYAEGDTWTLSDVSLREASNTDTLDWLAFDGQRQIKAVQARDSIGLGRGALAISDTFSDTAIGVLALNSGETSGDNVAVGYSAMASASCNYSVAVGNYALRKSTVQGNTAVGWAAMENCAGGDYNVAVGSSACRRITGGRQNVAIGATALAVNTTGDNNTAVGYSALSSNETGDSNVAVGWAALATATGVKNTVVGAYSDFLTTGSYNTILGAYVMSLPGDTTGNIVIADGHGGIKAHWNGSAWSFATGVSGSFTTADGKTVTVVGGLITSIDAT
jgi:hypothetical protein